VLHGEEAAYAFMIAALAAMPVFVVLALWIRRKPAFPWKRKAVLLGAPLALFVVGNPLGQFFFLGPLSYGLRERMCEQATTEHLVGKPPEVVAALYGVPCERRHEHPAIVGANHPVTYVAEPYDAWEYAPLPIFWFGHGDHLKVFFRGGVVEKVKCAL
jgi:hypothetical protein